MWIYLSWLVVLMGATVASLLPALRLRRWARLPHVGARAVDALGILRLLWQARQAQPPGHSLTYLENHLRVHPDELRSMLQALYELGYAVPVADEDRWVLACDPAQADIGPLIDRLLIDRHQPGLRHTTLAHLADALQGHPPVLDVLFNRDATAMQGDDAQ